MHGYEVHEAFYQANEIHGPLLSIGKRDRGKLGHIMNMYDMLYHSHQLIFSINVKFYHNNFETRW